MGATIRSIRRRLLESMDRPVLERLSNWEDAPKRGRDTIIAYILDGRWTIECDKEVKVLTDSINHKVKSKYQESKVS